MANVEGMVRAGIEAYRAGKNDEAKALLLAAVDKDEQNEQAWMWLSQVVEEVEDRRTCLENVLAINPGNTLAQQGLKMLEKRSGGTSAPKASSDDVLASATLGTQPPVSRAPAASSKPPTSPFSTLDDDELPSSIEWEAPATETSSASSQRKVAEPSASEYDNWVSNLGIGGSKPGGSSFDMSAASAFIGAAPDDEDEDDFFNMRANAAAASGGTPPPASKQSVMSPDHDPFGGADPFADSEDDVFGAAALGNTFEAMSSTSSRAPEPRPVADPSPTGRKSPLPPPAPAKPAPKLSPGKENPPAVEEEEEEDVFSEMGMDTDDGYEMDPNEYFEFIPAEIKPTRLPTMGDKLPPGLVIGTVILLLLNIAAAVFLAMGLSGS